MRECKFSVEDLRTEKRDLLFFEHDGLTRPDKEAATGSDSRHHSGKQTLRIRREPGKNLTLSLCAQDTDACIWIQRQPPGKPEWKRKEICIGHPWSCAPFFAGQGDGAAASSRIKPPSVRLLYRDAVIKKRSSSVVLPAQAAKGHRAGKETEYEHHHQRQRNDQRQHH